MQKQLSKVDQMIDDLIFSTVLPEEQFTCTICQQRFELEHEAKYTIDGIFSGRKISKPIHISICEGCSLDLSLLEVEGY